ncbi:SDR family NAD(P)-dependent oxidoreductase [Haloarcula litorea]|uniref:SDR family NAD(P)-dependent oxidoreductase n=1 Tax=Haloarcula litorea TaxID=3032579 RepID=UPI0023E85534|nr:SDR family NAD(P)-dependent oxidoreductase [Halomicroarcula sp. GDY20]
MTKTVLISDAASPVGRATAEAFREDDWDVWAGAADPELVDDLEADGCRTVELDVTNARECERAVETVVDEAGRIDCLVHDGGRGRVAAVEDTSTVDLEARLDGAVLGAHRLVREVLPHMRDRGDGAIVSVGGVAGRLTLPGQGSTAAAQAALGGLHDALRVEAAEFGVDVVLVEPGPLDLPGEPESGAAAADEPAAAATPDGGSGPYDWLYSAHEDSRLTGLADAVSVTPRAVALTVRDAANASDPEPRYPVGEPAKYLLLAARLPARWRDAAVSVARRFVD